MSEIVNPSNYDPNPGHVHPTGVVMEPHWGFFLTNFAPGIVYKQSHLIAQLMKSHPIFPVPPSPPFSIASCTYTTLLLHNANP